MEYVATYDVNYLEHHGILGQKWGVRRYQNEDGTLTELGKKHQEEMTASDKEATIAKGTKMYRVSTKADTDAGDWKMYVSATKDQSDFYNMHLGSNNIYSTGKAYVHQYIAKADIVMPDKKTMEKIELGLLKDKEVQKELVDSLMKKGYSREAATEYVKPYSAGKDFVDKAIVSGSLAFVGGFYGAVAGATTGTVPGVAIGATVGAGLGLGLSLPLASVDGADKTRALSVIRMSYGDKENKLTNKKLRDELAAKGYNAIKDYNDRRAYGENGKQAVIVMDSGKNVELSKSWELSKETYGKDYARNYLKEHPNSKLSYNDLVSDGEKKYQQYYEQGIIARERAKTNKEILAKAGVTNAVTTSDDDKKKKSYGVA